MKEYDYLVVGAGLFGSVFAHEATKRGKKCLVIDRRNHIGGNIYTENIEGINAHKYGPHIFHTNDLTIWNYVNALVPFNNYKHNVIANYKGTLYNLPFNMNTFYKLWNVVTPEEAKAKIKSQQQLYENPETLEEQALALGGKDIFEKLIQGYTEKQWGRPSSELPAFIIKRLPFRFTFNNDYFTDKYQGIPIGGYTRIAQRLLENVEVKLNIDFFQSKSEWQQKATRLVFTGMIDRYFDYQFGTLQYRSLRFENTLLDIPNFQGCTQMNYTDKETPYTRIIEHKHFEFGEQAKTYITKEYSQEWNPGSEPYYPINDEKNNAIYLQYRKMSEQEPNTIFGGRLAEYKYYDMHQIIGSALHTIKTEFGK
jgi:UDP-galactopyranose mutase